MRCPWVWREKKQNMQVLKSFFRVFFSFCFSTKIQKISPSLLSPCHTAHSFLIPLPCQRHFWRLLNVPRWNASWPHLPLWSTALLFIINSCFCPRKILLSSTFILHAFLVCWASVTGVLPYSLLILTTLLSLSFLYPCLPEGRRKERF